MPRTTATLLSTHDPKELFLLWRRDLSAHTERSGRFRSIRQNPRSVVATPLEPSHQHVRLTGDA
jgi:hypothetical protein